MNITRKLLVTAALIGASLSAHAAVAQNITYQGTDKQAGYDISYSITTNGTVGTLSLDDIVGSSITFNSTPDAVYSNVGAYAESGTLYFSNTNAGAISPVSATTTNLLFDFGNRGGLNFCAGPLCYALAALGINDTDAVVYGHGDVVSEDPFIVVPFASRELDNPDATQSRLADGTYTRVLPTVQSFATATGTVTGAVPEPATWMMMILGMGAVGYAMRRRKVSTQVSYAA